MSIFLLPLTVLLFGGGTAGLAIACGLAESNSAVAVVEAGSFYELDNGNFTERPRRRFLLPCEGSIIPKSLDRLETGNNATVEGDILDK